MSAICHENNRLKVCSHVAYWLTINLVHVAEGICRKLPSATHGIWSWLTIWALLLREDMMMRTRQISKRCHLCPLQPLTWNLVWGKKCLREIFETKVTYSGIASWASISSRCSGCIVFLQKYIDLVSCLALTILQVSKMIVTGFLLWCGESWILVKHTFAYL